MKDSNLIAICGKSGSGKDTVLSSLIEQRQDIFNKVILYTTRPKRPGEINGENYHFIDKETMTYLLMNGELVSSTEYRGWFYGVSPAYFVNDKINIGAFSPEQIMQMDETINILASFWIEAKDYTRMTRSLKRGGETMDIREACRRFLADEEDFKVFEKEFWELENGVFKKKISNEGSSQLSKAKKEILTYSIEQYNKLDQL